MDIVVAFQQMSTKSDQAHRPDHRARAPCSAIGGDLRAPEPRAVRVTKEVIFGFEAPIHSVEIDPMRCAGIWRRRDLRRVVALEPQATVKPAMQATQMSVIVLCAIIAFDF